MATNMFTKFGDYGIKTE